MRQDGDQVGESLVLVGVGVAHVVDLLRVEPSLGVGDLRVVFEEVHADGDRLWAGGGDRLELDGGDDTLGVVLRLEGDALLFGEIAGRHGFEHVRGVGDSDGGALREL